MTQKKKKIVSQLFPQLVHLATCEWWNCRLTWIYYCRQVVAKIVELQIWEDKNTDKWKKYPTNQIAPRHIIKQL